MKKIILTEGQRRVLKKYAKLLPEYKQFNQEVTNLIKAILNSAGISFIEIAGRVKKVESFKEKMVRKNYKNPLLDMKDICAIRIVCSFPEDLRKIQRILKEIFLVLTYKNGEQNVSPYKFWYRSHHFKIRLNEEQIIIKKYKLLKYFIAEVQVRTVFMDAWARMEHEINYKHEWSTSNETKRKLSRLSAILELADEQMQELVDGRENLKLYNKYYQKFKSQRIKQKKSSQRPFT